MNRQEFTDDASVKAFVDWAAATLPSISIHLRVGRSRFVPNAVDSKLTGIHQVSPLYVWRATGMSTGDWTETHTHLDKLSTALRIAVKQKDNPGALKACENILEWGGVRNWETGAYPFLQQVNGAVGLTHYLRETRAALSLGTADTIELTAVRSMNAMLTKVHALLADDGLPIYDSRVAAAIAALVELWRRSAGLVQAPLPEPLLFPATLRTRTVSRLCPDAIAPGVIAYNQPETAGIWSSAKVRLGWLMQMLSAKLDKVWAGLTMRKFEATLFMVGYDITCLSGAAQPVQVLQQNPTQPIPETVEPTFSDLTNDRSLMTLSGRGSSILLASRQQGGYYVKWGELRFILDEAILDEIETEFCGRQGVPLGAKVDGEVSPESFGHWLVENGWPSRRYASALAPILVHLEIVKNVSRDAGFALDF